MLGLGDFFGNVAATVKRGLGSLIGSSKKDKPEAPPPGENAKPDIPEAKPVPPIPKSEPNPPAPKAPSEQPQAPPARSGRDGETPSGAPPSKPHKTETWDDDFAGYMGGEEKSVSSSNVASSKYDSKEKYMEIGFIGGKRYGYHDVSSQEATSFFSAKSKGGWVWDHLRRRGTRFGYQKSYAFISGQSKADAKPPKYYEDDTHREEHRAIGPGGDTPDTWKAGKGPYKPTFGLPKPTWGTVDGMTTGKTRPHGKSDDEVKALTHHKVPMAYHAPKEEKSDKVPDPTPPAPKAPQVVHTPKQPATSTYSPPGGDKGDGPAPAKSGRLAGVRSLVGKGKPKGGRHFEDGGEDPEGGEFIVNKESSEKHAGLLAAMGGKPIEGDPAVGDNVPVQTSAGEVKATAGEFIIPKEEAAKNRNVLERVNQDKHLQEGVEGGASPHIGRGDPVAVPAGMPSPRHKHFARGGDVGPHDNLPKVKDFGTDEELTSLLNYQHERDINPFLRGKPSPESRSKQQIIKDVTNIDSLMGRSKLPEMTLYRGGEIREAGKNNKNILSLPGKVISDPGFVSTTTKPRVMSSFAGMSDHAVEQEIHVPAGTPGLSLHNQNVGRNAYFSNEDEVLLDRNSQFKVNSVEKLPKIDKKPDPSPNNENVTKKGKGGWGRWKNHGFFKSTMLNVMEVLDTPVSELLFGKKEPDKYRVNMDLLPKSNTPHFADGGSVGKKKPAGIHDLFQQGVQWRGLKGDDLARAHREYDAEHELYTGDSAHPSLTDPTNILNDQSDDREYDSDFNLIPRPSQVATEWKMPENPQGPPTRASGFEVMKPPTRHFEDGGATGEKKPKESRYITGTYRDIAEKFPDSEKMYGEYGAIKRGFRKNPDKHIIYDTTSKHKAYDNDFDTKEEAEAVRKSEFAWKDIVGDVFGDETFKHHKDLGSVSVDKRVIDFKKSELDGKPYVSTDFQFDSEFGEKGFDKQQQEPDASSFALAKKLRTFAKRLKQSGFGIKANGYDEKRDSAYEKVLTGKGVGMKRSPGTDVYFGQGGFVGDSHFSEGGDVFDKLPKFPSSGKTGAEHEAGAELGHPVNDWMTKRYGKKTAAMAGMFGQAATWAGSAGLSLAMSQPAILPPGSGVGVSVAAAEAARLFRKWRGGQGEESVIGVGEDDDDNMHRAQGGPAGKGGEFIVNKESSSKHRHLLEKLGGKEIHGDPAIGDNVPVQTSAGEVKTTAGEFIIPEESAAKNRPLIEAVNQDKTHFATGGSVGGEAPPPPITKTGRVTSQDGDGKGLVSMISGLISKMTEKVGDQQTGRMIGGYLGHGVLGGGLGAILGSMLGETLFGGGDKDKAPPNGVQGGKGPVSDGSGGVTGPSLAADRLIEAANLLKESARQLSDAATQMGAEPALGDSNSGHDWHVDENGNPILAKRGTVPAVTEAPNPLNEIGSTVGYGRQAGASASPMGIFPGSGSPSPITGNAAAGGVEGGAGAMAGPVGLALMAGEAVKKVVEGVRDSLYGADANVREFGEGMAQVVGVPKSISELGGSLFSFFSPLRIAGSLIGSLSNPTEMFKNGLTSATDVLGKTIKVFSDLRDPSNLIRGAVSPFQSQVQAYNPGAVDRLNLALDNLSAAMGRIFEPIIEGARGFADELNVLFTGVAPDLRDAVTRFVQPMVGFGREVMIGFVDGAQRISISLGPIASRLLEFAPIVGTWIGGAGTLIAFLVDVARPTFERLTTAVENTTIALMAAGRTIEQRFDQFRNAPGVAQAANVGGAVNNVVGQANNALWGLFGRGARQAADFVEPNFMRNFNDIRNEIRQGREPLAGAMTFAAQPARHVGIEQVGMDARAAAFSQGGTIEEQQLVVQQDMNRQLQNMAAVMAAAFPGIAAALGAQNIVPQFGGGGN